MAKTLTNIMQQLKQPLPLPITICRSVHQHTVEKEGIRSRKMSTSTSELAKEYLVFVPDFSGALQKRLEARSAHIEGSVPMINSGQLPYFGVTLSKHPSKDEKPDINGSLMVIMAECEMRVRETLEKDAYTKAGVWDIKNAKIFPFKSG